MNKEEILQHEIVVCFNNHDDYERGTLFAIRNISLNRNDAVKQKGLGMVKGVSDLVYIRPCGKIVGIEVKHPEMSHSRTHIESQLNWGKIVENNNGEYYIVNSVSEFWNVITEKEVKYTIAEIERLLKVSKSKIKFI